LLLKDELLEMLLIPVLLLFRQLLDLLILVESGEHVLPPLDPRVRLVLLFECPFSIFFKFLLLLLSQLSHAAAPVGCLQVSRRGLLARHEIIYGLLLGASDVIQPLVQFLDAIVPHLLVADHQLLGFRVLVETLLGGLGTTHHQLSYFIRRQLLLSNGSSRQRNR